MSIRLSKKHGLNPTIPICFFCGEHKNEIALMGELKGDIEAPKNLLLDYEPCDKCKKKFKEGVLIIEATQYPNVKNQPPIQKDAYPTGRYILVKPEVFKEPYNKAGTTALMHLSDYEKLIIGSKKEELSKEN